MLYDKLDHIIIDQALLVLKCIHKSFSQIRLIIRGIPADALWISSSALAVKTSWVHPE